MTSRRQKARAAREAEFWAAKFRAAETTGEQAAVVWDQVRARVNGLPPARHETAWTAVLGELEQALELPELAATPSDVLKFTSHRSSHGFRPQRPDARGRARG